MPTFKNIRPVFGDTIYYLMFVITHESDGWKYRLCQCPQADRLSGLLPPDLIIEEKGGVVTYDSRIENRQAIQLCEIFWSLLKAPDQSGGANPKAPWARKEGDV